MSDRPIPRRALDAPSTDVTLMSQSLIDQAVDAARASDRRRMILPLHKSADEPFHRMFNALQPGTYIPPHRHLDPPKAESILVVRGAVCFVAFDNTGQVTTLIDLTSGGATFGVDVAAGVFHTFFVLEPDTVVFEAKTGPYSPVNDKDFATWAPGESNPARAEYLASLELERRRRHG